jgi:T-complex protein 1 subunit eta
MQKVRKKFDYRLIKFFFLDNIWYGVDILHEDVSDNFTAAVWEPAVVKINAITAASEAACLILSVDETIKVPKSSGEPSNAAKAMNMD